VADQESIDAHNRLILDWVDRFAQGLSPLFVELFDRIAQLQNPTRLQIAQLFGDLRNYIQTEMQNINQVLDSSVDLNSAVLGTSISPSVTQQITEITAVTTREIITALEEDQNEILNIFETAVITGGIAVALTGLRKEIPRFIRKIKFQFENSVRGIDSVFTLLRGREREVKYRYSGPTDSDSRQFCQQQSGTILTEAEIRRIWSTQEWGGKRPGDPFVTRGGWNCRHTFIPVGDDE
jgi:hypothetical protein